MGEFFFDDTINPSFVESNSYLKKGKLITFEGVDGAGKSTQIQLLSQYLDKNNIPNLCTREPGSTSLGTAIRKLVLSNDTVELSFMSELMMYAADRAQHCKQVIIPSLKKGLIVLCDRFVDSSVAYQGYGRGIEISTIDKLNEFATLGCAVYKTIFLDISPKLAFARKGGQVHDRLETSGLDFFNKVYDGYLSLCNKYPNRITKVDASLSEAKLHQLILKVLNFSINQPIKPQV
ncbi:MAG: dTMP kinase [Clostridiales bacterium]|jgi:dTMP kinase|nr:dTMP kinase [Clostridiales bacterium]